MAKDMGVKAGPAVGDLPYTNARKTSYNCRFSGFILSNPSPAGGHVSPILVRPVREQLEHDRVIRLLQVRLKRRDEVQTNIGEDQKFSVRIGQVMIFPTSC